MQTYTGQECVFCSFWGQGFIQPTHYTNINYIFTYLVKFVNLAVKIFCTFSVFCLLLQYKSERAVKNSSLRFVHQFVLSVSPIVSVHFSSYILKLLFGAENVRLTIYYFVSLQDLSPLKAWLSWVSIRYLQAVNTFQLVYQFIEMKLLKTESMSPPNSQLKP